MSKKRLKLKPGTSGSVRRVFDAEFKREAVQMLLDGHTAASVAERLGLSGTNLLYDNVLINAQIETAVLGLVGSELDTYHTYQHERTADVEFSERID